jgi:lipoprotein-anchoring transpeptidase ErfK/SrfK
LIKGKPESHGCIRMKNADVVDLFNSIDVGIKVLIK